MGNTIFLDLDGVIVDFISGVLEWYNIDKQHDDMVGWNDIITASGKSTVKFWQGLDSRDFWLGLKKYEYADEILDMVSRAEADTCILTSPAFHIAGYRQDWIQDNMPDYFTEGRYLIGPAKAYCSYQGAFLIDDSDSNCKLFDKFDGVSILFPQPWNNMREYAPDNVKWLEEELVMHDLLI